MRPMRATDPSVNHSAPSGPETISGTVVPACPKPVKVVSAPAVVILPTKAPAFEPNHKLPSGPVVIPVGCVAVPELNSLTTPAVVIAPISSEPNSVNHNCPSG